jgi:hypothetical protein
MSGFYLYLIFPWFKFLGFIFSWNIKENQIQLLIIVLNYAQIKITHSNQERIQDFKLGGGALKKNCAERREAQNFLGYFVWKIMILSQKIIFFSNFRGGGCLRTPGAPPPGFAPENIIE